MKKTSTQLPLLPDLASPTSLPWTGRTAMTATTSHAAAEQMAGRATSLRRAVLAAIVESPNGLTDLELQAVLGMNGSTQRPRRIELHRARFIAASPATRRTPSGRLAVVWIATPAGRALVR